MKVLWRRALTALFFTAFILGCIYGGQISFCLLITLISILASNEFLNHTLDEKHLGIRKTLSILLNLILAASISAYYLLNIAWHFPLTIAIITCLQVLIFIIELFLKSEKPFRNIAFGLMSFLYTGIFISGVFFIAFKNGSYVPNLIFAIFALTWANDTFAYLTGSVFGKTLLFERISPKKTWEGTMGGFIMTLVVSYIFYLWFGIYSPWDWIIFAIIISIIGNLGDLVESMFKRSLNIKDSGNILPGHGGILDRFDSFLMHLPVLAVYILLLHGF